MSDETPLAKFLRQSFESFKVEKPVAVNSAKVKIAQYVNFKISCEEQARETLTIEKDPPPQMMPIGDQGYFILKKIVDGPVTDGNRQQIVDDCVIRTIVKMEAFVDGVTNVYPRPDQQKNVVSSISPLQTTSSSTNDRSTGCRSHESSLFVLIFSIVFILHFFRSRHSGPKPNTNV